MANRIFSRNAKSLGTVGNGFCSIKNSSPREYSKRSWRSKNTYVEHVLFGHIEKRNQTVWPDPNLGCLGDKDKRFSLPGNIGLDAAVLRKADDTPTPERIKADKKLIDDEIAFWKNLNDSPTNHQRQIDLLKQHEEVEKIEMEEREALERIVKGSEDILECKAQNCPDLLRRELTGLFRSVNLMEGALTVVTFCLKTKNDMSSWSPDVEDERDQLVEDFIKAAKDLCGELRNRAQWADFIEPASGRPFYGKYTNLTFFETDERYRHLGFRVQDLGCCKVVAHHKWGTHAFVGTIFTSAPHDSEYLQQIIYKCNQSMNSK